MPRPDQPRRPGVQLHPVRRRRSPHRPFLSGTFSGSASSTLRRADLSAIVCDRMPEAWDRRVRPVPEGCPIRHRLRRWFGTTQEADARNRVFPLHSPIGVALAFSLGPRDRRSYWIHRQILDRTCPQLGDMPFATGRWPTAVVPTQTPEPATPTDPTELPVASDSRSAVRRFIGAHVRRRQPVAAANEERRRSEGTDVQMMRRYLLDEPPEPLFEILDRPAVERAIPASTGSERSPRSKSTAR
jgi:hypothetical protein